MASKLVRDGIPTLMASKGLDRIKVNDAITKASTYEAKDLLLAKLNEEVKEVEDCLCIEELADVLEVVYGLLKSQRLGTREDLEAVRYGKYLARGGFNELYVLDLEKYHA